MAVAYDVYSYANAETTAAFNWTHTPTGTPRGVLVFISQETGTTDEVSGVTYGGTAMQRVGFQTCGTTEPGAVYAYFLGAGLGTGAKSVAVSVSGSTYNRCGYAVTVTAAGDTNCSAKQPYSGTDNISFTLAMGAVTAFVAEGFIAAPNAPTGTTPPTGWTSRAEFDHGVMIGGLYTYNTVASDNVTTCGLTESGDAAAIAAAISETWTRTGSVTDAAYGSDNEDHTIETGGTASGIDETDNARGHDEAWESYGVSGVADAQSARSHDEVVESYGVSGSLTHGVAAHDEAAWNWPTTSATPYLIGPAPSTVTVGATVAVSGSTTSPALADLAASTDALDFVNQASGVLIQIDQADSAYAKEDGNVGVGVSSYVTDNAPASDLARHGYGVSDRVEAEENSASARELSDVGVGVSYTLTDSARSSDSQDFTYQEAGAPIEVSITDSALAQDELPKRSQTPALTVLDPNPVNAGATLTVEGGIGTPSKISDTVLTTDVEDFVVQAGGEVNVSATDNAAAQDQENEAYAASSTATDNAAAQDQENAGAASSYTLTDSARGADQENAGAGISYTLTDSARGADQENAGVGIGYTLTDSARSSDVEDHLLQSATAVGHSLTDRAVTADQENIAQTYKASISDGAPTGDIEGWTISSGDSFGLSVTDGARTTDQENRAYALSVSVSDGVQAKDALPNRSPAPTLTALITNPITVGATLTVNGIATLFQSERDSVQVGDAIGCNISSVPIERSEVDNVVSLDAWRVTHRTVLPATLVANDATGDSTALASGDDLRFGASTWAEYDVDAGAGGVFYFDASGFSLGGSVARISVDTVQQNGDWVIPSQEEEGDIMPAHAYNESTVSLSTGNATRLDPSPAAAKRYSITITNTHGTDRVFYAHSQGACTVNSIHVVEPDFGQATIFMDSNTQLWGIREGANTINVFVSEAETE